MKKKHWGWLLQEEKHSNFSEALGKVKTRAVFILWRGAEIAALDGPLDQPTALRLSWAKQMAGNRFWYSTDQNAGLR